ncbi:iron(III) transport system permease protein [Aquamicrobium terrae]
MSAIEASGRPAGGAEWLSARAAQKLLTTVSVVVPVAGLVLFFGYPLLMIAWQSLLAKDGTVGLANYAAIATTPGLITATVNSLVVSAATMLVSVVLGFVIAYALERSALRTKNLMRAALVLPLLAPSLVQALGLLFILGRNGLVHKWTGWDIDIYGFWGLLIANVFYALPQAVMILQAALRNADSRYYDAAEVMGASGWRQFVDITLPNTKFGLLSAAFVVFVITITDFGNAIVIGGNYRVLATEIYSQVSGQMDFGMGSVVGMLLLLPSLVSIYIERVASQRQFGGSSENLIPVSPKRAPLRDALVGGVCLLVAAAIVAIVAVVVFASFVKLWPYNLSFTLKNYNVDTSDGYASLWTTLKISLIAAAFGVVSLFMLTFGVRRLGGGMAKAVYLVAVLPVGVPGLVLGLSYIFAFNMPNSPLYILYGSAILIAICNFYHYHTQGFLTMMTGMRAVPTALEEAVSCFGGNLRCVLRDAVLPFMAPTVLSVFFFLFMRSMVTLSAVIFLVTPKVNVASVAVMRLDQAGFVSQAAAFSTWIMLIVGGALLAMRLILGRVSRRLGYLGQS